MSRKLCLILAVLAALLSACGTGLKPGDTAVTTKGTEACTHWGGQNYEEWLLRGVTVKCVTIPVDSKVTVTADPDSGNRFAVSGWVRVQYDSTYAPPGEVVVTTVRVTKWIDAADLAKLEK